MPASASGVAPATPAYPIMGTPQAIPAITLPRRGVILPRTHSIASAPANVSEISAALTNPRLRIHRRAAKRAFNFFFGFGSSTSEENNPHLRNVTRGVKDCRGNAADLDLHLGRLSETENCHGLRHAAFFRA